jgi:hypothetical protein
MNSNDRLDFQDAGVFLDIARDWKQQALTVVTYMLVCNRQISRLQGTSDILYIGQTEKLGGENNRLWNYHYAVPGNKTEYRVRECVRKLVSNGDAVSLRACPKPPGGLTVKQYESQLLGRYRDDHCEAPPLNSVG